MKFTAWILACALSALVIAGCGDDDDDDNDSAPIDDDTADDDASDDDADDDAGDDDTWPPLPDDDTADDDNDDDLEPVDNPVDFVNVFIGTGGIGYGMGALIPGPVLPGSMVKLTPDTSIGGFAHEKMHAGGYYYPDNTIRGISHMHLPGIGATDLCNVNLMPVDGISDEKVTNAGYRSPFSHDNESGEPGYYRVHLDRYDVDVELTSTMNAGFHRYTFAAGAEPYVVIDAGYANVPGQVYDAEVTIDESAREVYGMIDQRGGFTGRSGGLPIHFVARFSEPFEDFGTFDGGARTPGGTGASGPTVGAYVGFASAKGTVLAKVGLSIQSVEQARANLDAQIAAWDFDAVRAAASAAWNERLMSVQVAGGREYDKRIFYSALYHLDQLVTSYTEENGKYVGFDRAEHDADGFTYYTDLSLWDTFRTFHPLVVLLHPDYARDMAISLVKMYEQGGAFPKWAQGLGDTGSMIGTHSDSVIADAYIKGVTDFDIDTAYEGLRAHALGPVPYGNRDHVDSWISRGWLSADQTSGSVSKTQEYAYNDYCLSVLADALGETADAGMFAERAGNYANLWDEDTKFFRARDESGDFLPGFLEAWLWYDEYVEGNARHWRWFVPHDVPGLIDLFGGEEEFVAELDAFFAATRPQPKPYGVLPDLFYYHGNEPDIHAPYLFNYAGRPDLTAKWVRWVLHNRHRDAPAGVYGNDDGGTLSAWAVFTMLGFYPVAPCSPYYQIGSPVFPWAKVRVGENELVITAENASFENIYVQSAALNGEPLDVPWFTHNDIAGGGTLEFVMGPEPSAWGQGAVFEE